jgi:hypothetical protein
MAIALVLFRIIDVSNQRVDFNSSNVSSLMGNQRISAIKVVETSSNIDSAITVIEDSVENMMKISVSYDSII